MISIIENESLINHIDEYDIILIGTNCYQSMANGFQYEVAKKYPYVKQINNKTKYGDISKLGSFVECKEEKQPLFLLLFISFGYNFKGNDKEFIDYNALEENLKLINLLYPNKKIATTLIGGTHFDGNGNKEKILQIINEKVTSFDLSIYDYKQLTHLKLDRKDFFDKLKKKREKIIFKKRKQ